MANEKTQGKPGNQKAQGREIGERRAGLSVRPQGAIGRDDPDKAEVSPSADLEG